jgi:hypothetical protein
MFLKIYGGSCKNPRTMSRKDWKVMSSDAVLVSSRNWAFE